MLTPRYVEAVNYASLAHARQLKKGTQVPYMAHLLGVSSLVLDHGGDEDQAIAGLLHDVVEDCGQEHEQLVRLRFGDRVADMVVACTDGSQELKGREMTPEQRTADWRERKERYIAELGKKSRDALLVSCCDKLHNARAIVSDAEGLTGLDVFKRFKGGLTGTLWYYRTLSGSFMELDISAAHELSRTVRRMHELAEGAR